MKMKQKSFLIMWIALFVIIFGGLALYGLWHGFGSKTPEMYGAPIKLGITANNQPVLVDTDVMSGIYTDEDGNAINNFSSFCFNNEEFTLSDFSSMNSLCNSLSRMNEVGDMRAPFVRNLVSDGFNTSDSFKTAIDDIVDKGTFYFTPTGYEMQDTSLPGIIGIEVVKNDDGSIDVNAEFYGEPNIGVSGIVFVYFMNGYNIAKTGSTGCNDIELAHISAEDQVELTHPPYMEPETETVVEYPDDESIPADIERTDVYTYTGCTYLWVNGTTVGASYIIDVESAKAVMSMLARTFVTEYSHDAENWESTTEVAELGFIDNELADGELYFRCQPSSPTGTGLMMHLTNNSFEIRVTPDGKTKDTSVRVGYGNPDENYIPYKYDHVMSVTF